MQNSPLHSCVSPGRFAVLLVKKGARSRLPEPRLDRCALLVSCPLTIQIRAGDQIPARVPHLAQVVFRPPKGPAYYYPTGMLRL